MWEEFDELGSGPACMENPKVAEQIRLAWACAQFNEEAFGGGVAFPEVGGRQALAITAFFLTHENHGSVLHLFLAGREGSALAMLRPCFESLVRGIWLLRGSNDEQLRLFCEGRDSKKVEALLKDLRKGPQASEDAFLAETWAKSERSLHQFTHISYQLLARRAPEEELEAAKDHEEVGDAVRFASGTAMLATIELARMAKLPDMARRASNLLALLFPTES